MSELLEALKQFLVDQNIYDHLDICESKDSQITWDWKKCGCHMKLEKEGDEFICKKALCPFHG